MRAYKLFLIIISICQISLLSIENNKYTPAPKGFSWSNSGPNGTNFLIPNDWFLKTETTSSTYGIFISKEEIINNKEFRTGLSVNVIKNVSEKTNIQPTKYAKKFIINFLESIKQKYNGHLYSEPWSNKDGDFSIYGIQSKDDFAIMHHVLFANDKKDILYIVLFESPVDEWNDNWKTGKIILDNIFIDDNI